MGNTQGYVSQDSPNIDGIVYIPAKNFYDVTNGAVLAPAFEDATANPATGTMKGWHTAIPAATAQETFNIQCDIPDLMARFGMFANPSETQQQYGTASGEPGPSSTALITEGAIGTNPFPGGNNTSSPLAQTGFPPVTGFPIVPTVGAVTKGVAPKSLVINYGVTVAALTASTIAVWSRRHGLVKSLTAGAVVVSSGQIIIQGLDTAYAAVSASGTEFLDPTDVLFIVINGTKGATSVLTIYSMFLNVAYNLN